MFETVWSDIRYAVRLLLAQPVFTVVAVLSLGVGIGFNSAIFSAVDALLFRPLPVDRASRLADIYTAGRDGDTYSTNSYPDYVDFRSRNDVFEDIFAYSPAIAAVRAGDRSRMALGELVTGNYFPVLGVRPALGRLLSPEDDRPGAPRVAVISNGFWQRAYGGNPDVLARTVTIHGQSYAIVGVAPAAFTGMVPMLQPEMWLPLAWVDEVEPAGMKHTVPSPTGNTWLDRRGQRWLFIRGRLKDGETAARAEANLRVIMRQLATAYPQTNEKFPVAVAAAVRIHPEADKLIRPAAAGLMVGIGLVLLVACANVANMLLARASGRGKEIGVRLAIGATRGRLVRQLLTESVVLAVGGAAVGVGLAGLLLRLVDVVPLPIPVPLAFGMRIDGRVLLFTTLLAGLTGIIAGLAPALRATRPDLVSDLKGGASAAKTSTRRWSLGNGLAAAQTTVTLVLLVAAGLLTRSILAAHRIDLGFRTEGVVAVSTEYSLIGYSEARAAQLIETAADRVRAMPGVRSVSRSIRQPLAINFNTSSIFFPDAQAPGESAVPIASTWVDDQYLSTLGVPLLGGRNISPADVPSSPLVAVVNEAFARRYWPDTDAVGRHFKLRGMDGPDYEVVGIVGNYKVQSIGEQPTPYIHFAIGQRTYTGTVLIARFATDPETLLAAIRRELLTLEPNTVLFENQTMTALVDTTLIPARLAAQTLVVVGLVATGLAAIGLYGVVAHTVSRRRREIGIRMALGATPRVVQQMILRQGLTVVGAGLPAGVALSWVGARAIAGGLYGITATDPVAWGGAVVVLLGAAALANLLPARRAARIDPSIALRLD